MKIEEVKRNLGRMVKYRENSELYRLTGCILRRGKEGLFYQAEILDTKHGNSVIICKLEDVEGLQ